MKYRSLKIIISLIIIVVITNNCTKKEYHLSLHSGEKINDYITSHFYKKINAEEKRQKLKEYFQELAKNRDFNGNVLIAQNGLIIYVDSFGYANFATKEKLTTKHKFQIASVSKQFTAVAILKLKEMGYLSLDDTIRKFIPDFPYHSITIRHLLTHKSGLFNYIYFLDKISKKVDFNNLNNEKLLDLIKEYKPTNYYQPGVKYDYSNTGYAILASIVEKTMGMPFETFMEFIIFKPCGMNDTYVYNINKKEIPPPIAKGHNPNKTQAQSNLYLNAVVGDKGIYSTVYDLFKWDQSLYEEKIIKRSTLEEAFIISNPESKKNSNYGMGWRIYFLPDSTKVLYHTGWWQGFQSLLTRIEKDKTTIIILKNIKNNSFPSQRKIISILYPQLKLLDNMDNKDEDVN